MSADPMMQAVDLAFEKLFRPVRRVSHSEMKFNALPEEKQRHNVCAFVESKKDSDGWVYDQVVSVRAKDILENFRAGDDAANGELVKRALFDLAKRDDFWEDQ